MRWKLTVITLILTLFLFSCTTATTPTPPTKSHIITAQKSPETSAKRVVALSSLSADIIFQLDATKLVGMTGSSLFKNDPRFKDIPSVSEGQNAPNLEKIVALKPDLVIGVAGFSDVPMQKLKQIGIPTLSTKVYSWESLEELTKTIAKIIDVDPQPVLNYYKTLLPESQNNSSSTLVLVSRQPILTPNKNSWAGDLISRFGAKNIAAELQGNSPIGGYVTLSAEKVLEANPEVLIVVNAEPNLLNSLKKEPFWQKLQATKSNRVYIFDYYGLVNPGSLNAIAKTCQELQKIFLQT
ncbi:ABC transporter substrate-binding protein [Sphaerospermopsis aphanizomenoides BCCUSP55]|uniref:ABC transporter substrate-binding protein n=1 Tax=Sphaerospermopsis aphanizomenoides TaxID=459663 RepID=UPI0019076CEE|nr:ABC transporter substrate-binding protein [Sphaerospermopsis aphanizomenoides]MBK1986053.1 ABC transporter substrate-binding protein [Sphaerospermopsis aphanizomenoides BCCUSP55]